MNRLFLRALAIWIVFFPIPFINGILREVFYKRLIGEQLAGIVGIIIISLAFFAVAFLMFRKNITQLSTKTLFLIGLLWVTLSVFVEFGLGLFVFRDPLEELLSAYNILEGELWVLFLLTMLLSPLIIRQLNKNKEWNLIT